MARIRTIKPEFWESETIGTLSFGARLLFLACLNMADDEGLLRWNPSYLQSNAFVYDEVEHSQILEWMGELENGFVFPYQAGKTNQKLAWIINFRNHQVINRPQPSKLPGPSIQNSKFRDAIYERDKNICHLCGKEVVRHERTNISGSKAPSIDHIKPLSKGGSDYPSNLKTAHISCNKSRGNDDMNDSVSDSVNESVNDSVAERKGKEGKGKEEEIKTLSGKPDPIPYQAILDDMNATLNRQFHLTGDFKKLVKARWSEGFREPDFHTVCEKMQIKWGRDPTMAPYLRPATLFQASKFDGYLNTEITLSDKGVVSTTTQRNMDVFERFAREVENA